MAGVAARLNATNPVANVDVCNALAYRFDHTRALGAEDEGKRLAAAVGAVRALTLIDLGEVQADRSLANQNFAGTRVLNLVRLDLQDARVAVSVYPHYL